MKGLGFTISSLISLRELVQEVGWDSPKPGYDGLVDIAKRLLVQYRTGEETERATVQLIPHLLLL